MSTTYNLLLSTLDSIISEAPKNSKKYDISTPEGSNQARARALIHLYLKTKFGLIKFEEAEKRITDGAQDGGLDAYFIDQSNKKIYLIQSKFRNTESNFENSDVDPYEIFKMELDRITKGESLDTKGIKYNGKIEGFQREIREISDIGKYKYVLVFLGNVSDRIDEEKLNRVCGKVVDEFEILNGKDIYNRVLLPYLQSDYYDGKELVLKIKVQQNQSNRINYFVDLEGNNVHINLFFIPTVEIAKTLGEYQNALLHYNPRCFVGMNDGKVNNQIKKSITDNNSNIFSLLNNGITIICNGFEYIDRNAEPNSATLIISNPQIVNGGQTAFTLSKILEAQDESVFNNKEVLVKFISFNDSTTGNQEKLIEQISEATNNQTPVDLPDRMSNHPKLIEMQKYLFEKYGFLVERKKGEFYNSIEKKIINTKSLIFKDEILRLDYVKKGKVSAARSYTSSKIFKAFPILDYKEVDFDEIFTLISIYNLVKSLETNSRDQEIKYSTKKYGYALRYGKYALTSAIYRTFISGNYEIQHLDTIIKLIQTKWLDFETTLSNIEHNKDYFDEAFNFDNYYKGKTIDRDLAKYFDYNLETNENNKVVYYITYKHISARALYEDGQMVLLASSRIISRDRKYNEDYNHHLKLGNIIESDDFSEVINVIPWDTPSGASGFVYGRESNGWQDWKDSSGNTLNDNERRDD